MSILHKATRPEVVFDANNPQHRKYYAEFVEKGTFGYCPVRFRADELYGDLITHINAKMLHYYVTQEFKNLKKNKGQTASNIIRGRKSVLAENRAVEEAV